MTPAQLSTTRLADADDAVVDLFLGLVVTASHDPAVVGATYLPPGLDRAAARTWVIEQGPHAWVLHAGGAPVGFYRLSPVSSSCGFALPPNTWEREVWLIERARGAGLVRAATETLRPTLLAAGVEHILAVMWESNASAIAGVRRAGFTRLGRAWWEHHGFEPGWCEVWTTDLRTPSARA